jgi:hypothetical protein
MLAPGYADGFAAVSVLITPWIRTEAFYRIDQLLQGEVLVRQDDFLKALEVSPATFKRDLRYMRDRLNAPVIWDADAEWIPL